MRWQHCLSPHTDNIQKMTKSPDCLLCQVQPSDSQLGKTSIVSIHKLTEWGKATVGIFARMSHRLWDDDIPRDSLPGIAYYANSKNKGHDCQESGLDQSQMDWRSLLVWTFMVNVWLCSSYPVWHYSWSLPNGNISQWWLLCGVLVQQQENIAPRSCHPLGVTTASVAVDCIEITQAIWVYHTWFSKHFHKR